MKIMAWVSWLNYVKKTKEQTLFEMLHSVQIAAVTKVSCTYYFTINNNNIQPVCCKHKSDAGECWGFRYQL